MDQPATSHPLRVLTRALLVAIVSLAGAASCGGGGGSDGPAPSPTPRQTPIPVLTPTPTPSPTPTVAPVAGVPQVILSEDETVAGDLRLNDIREGALAADGGIAVIVRLVGPANARAVLRRNQDGTYESVFDPSLAPPEVDLTTVEDLRLASGGQVVFKTGDGLDSDRLYFAGPETTAVALAGASPGVEPPEFRALGDVDLGPDGGVAFNGGGSPCETDDEGSTRCDLHLYVSEGADLSEVEVGDNDLTDQNPRSPRTEVRGDGATFFSFRGSGEESTLIRVQDGEVDTLLSVDTEVPGVGRLINPTLELVGPGTRFLVQTAQQEDRTPRPLTLGILDLSNGRSFTEIARAGESIDGEVVFDFEALGFDGESTVLYRVFLREDSDDETAREALRLFDGTRNLDLAVELAPFGSDVVLELGDAFLNGRGEIAFLAVLGSVGESPEGPAQTVRATEVLVRDAAGTFSTRLPAAEEGDGPLLEPAALFGFDDAGALLAAGERVEENEELLIFVPGEP